MHIYGLCRTYASPRGRYGVWSTVLNDFLNVSHNDSGELENDTVSSLQILNNTIVDADISDITNLTLGEKITFTPGDIFITGSGSLNLNAKMGFSASSWEIYMAEGCQLAINSGGSIENV